MLPCPIRYLLLVACLSTSLSSVAAQQPHFTTTSLQCNQAVQSVSGNVSYHFIGQCTDTTIEILRLNCNAVQCSNIHILFFNTSVIPVLTIVAADETTEVSNISVELNGIFVKSGNLAQKHVVIPNGSSLMSITSTVIRNISLAVISSNISLSLNQSMELRNIMPPVFLIRFTPAAAAAAAQWLSSPTFVLGGLNVMVVRSVVNLRCNNNRGTAIMLGPPLQTSSTILNYTSISLSVAWSIIVLQSVQPTATNVTCGDSLRYTGSILLYLRGNANSSGSSFVDHVDVRVNNSAVYLQYVDNNLVAEAPSGCLVESVAAILFIAFIQNVSFISFTAMNLTSTTGFVMDDDQAEPSQLPSTVSDLPWALLPPPLERWKVNLNESKVTSCLVLVNQANITDNVVFHVTGSHVQTQGNMIGAGLVITEASQCLVSNVNIFVSTSTFLVFATGGSIAAGNLRFASVAYIQSSVTTTMLHATFDHLLVTAHVQSGNSASIVGAIACLIGLDSALIDSSIAANNIVLITQVCNGTAPTLTVRGFSMFLFGAATYLIGLTPSVTQTLSRNVSLATLSSAIIVQNQSFETFAALGSSTSIITAIQVLTQVEDTTFCVTNTSIVAGALRLPQICQSSLVLCMSIMTSISAVDTSQLLFSLPMFAGLKKSLTPYIGDRSSGSTLTRSYVQVADVHVCCNEFDKNAVSAAGAGARSLCLLLMMPQNFVSSSATVTTRTLSPPAQGNNDIAALTPARCIATPSSSSSSSVTPHNLWSAVGVLGGTRLDNSTTTIFNIALQGLHLLEVVDTSSSTNAASPVIMGNSSALVFSNVSLMWPAALCGEIVSGDISSPCHDQSLFSRVSTTLGTIKLQDTSQIFITASLFSGFHNFSGVTIINTTNTSRFKLGCNLWNHTPLNITIVEATIPPRMIDYPYNSISSFQDSSTNETVFTCNAYIEPPAPSTQAPTTLGDQLGGAAAPFFASAGVSAAIISANVGALGDLQVLFAASSSVCAPSGLRSMGKSSSFLLSPFTSLDGEAYQVIGNLGILACIVALHAGAVAVVAWRRQNSFAADTVRLEKYPQPSLQDGQPLSAYSSTSLLPPEAALQFPNLSFVAALLLAPGVVRTIPLLISASGEGSSVALQVTVGVVAVATLSFGVCWRAWLVVSSPLFSRLRFVPYRRSELDSVRLFNGSTSPVPRLLLPTGRWEPEIARRCYGRLRGAVHGGAVRWSMFRPCYQLLLCVLTGVPVPLSWCTGYWIVLCTVQAAVAVFVVVVRPSRARFTDILLALQMLISCATTASCAGVPHVSEDVVTALMMAAVIFSSLQMVHVAIVFRWEARALQAAWADEPLVTGTKTLGGVFADWTATGATINGGGTPQFQFKRKFNRNSSKEVLTSLASLMHFSETLTQAEKLEQLIIAATEQAVDSSHNQLPMQQRAFVPGEEFGNLVTELWLM